MRSAGDRTVEVPKFTNRFNEVMVKKGWVGQHGGGTDRGWAVAVGWRFADRLNEVRIIRPVRQHPRGSAGWPGVQLVRWWPNMQLASLAPLEIVNVAVMAEILTYKGIGYTVRASRGRGWILTFSPRKNRQVNKRLLGTWDHALHASRDAIDRWLANHGRERIAPSTSNRDPPERGKPRR